MEEQKSTQHLTFWDDKQAFLMNIQGIEQRCYYQSNHKNMCKSIRNENTVLALRQRVHDFPTKQVQEMFLPTIGMLLSDFAMYDVLCEFQKK